MSRSRQVLGKMGEEIAVRYLQQKGYVIIDRNVRLRVGEIDVVAKDDDTLVLVEVRTRRSARFGTALESVGPQKRRQLWRTATHYIASKNLHESDCRIDVISVSWSPSKDGPIIEHIENAIGD